MPARSTASAVLTLSAVLVLAGCSSEPPATEPGPSGTLDAPTQAPAEPPAPAGPPRNPFGLPDVMGALDAEVRAFAEKAPPLGDPSDANAEAWAATAGDAGTLDGAWQSRWRLDASGWVEGTAEVRTAGDIVYIRHVDEIEYLIEARREGDRLIGRYRLDSPPETTPWVGTVVSDTRIDGIWTAGRWDLRRAEPAPAAGDAP